MLVSAADDLVRLTGSGDHADAPEARRFAANLLGERHLVSGTNWDFLLVNVATKSNR